MRTEARLVSAPELPVRGLQFMCRLALSLVVSRSRPPDTPGWLPDPGDPTILVPVRRWLGRSGASVRKGRHNDGWCSHAVSDLDRQESLDGRDRAGPVWLRLPAHVREPAHLRRS